MVAPRSLFIFSVVENRSLYHNESGFALSLSLSLHLKCLNNLKFQAHLECILLQIQVWTKKKAFSTTTSMISVEASLLSSLSFSTVSDLMKMSHHLKQLVCLYFKLFLNSFGLSSLHLKKKLSRKGSQCLQNDFKISKKKSSKCLRQV